MQIILFVHPYFQGSQSMPRYANMLKSGMEELGHSVTVWTASPFFFRIPSPKFLKKWLGYIDQFIIFPILVKGRLRNCSNETLFVFADQALGPWVPLVSKRLHIIHCHDFLAQQSALGSIPENVTGWTGRLYQKFIANGYSKGKNFISISKKTQIDLHQLLKVKPLLSEVVYNGLNQKFTVGNPVSIRGNLAITLQLPLDNGFILHVGGNQFYKNRRGVIEIYDAWRKVSAAKLPLLLIGAIPNVDLQEQRDKSDFSADIYFFTSINDKLLQEIYQAASVLLFPSLAEGFGWPIAEAMASGCPVITTNEAPMNEVGGLAANYITKRPNALDEVKEWARESALTLNTVLEFTPLERNKCIESSVRNARRFDTENALKEIEIIYKRILKN